jgi:hypothetical protein
MGQFDTPEQMLTAARTLRESGHSEIDAYAPYPVHGMEEACGYTKSIIPKLVLGGGLAGAAGGYLLQFWCNAIEYPINVGGRPFHSPWQNVPVTFECGVLLGSLTAFLGLWMLCQLPRLHHPVFEVAKFRSASIDRFWVSVRTSAGDVDREKISKQLGELGASEISTVEEGVYR